MKHITFNETPRPQFVRDSFTLLDGKWDFLFDEEDEGEIKGYQNGFKKQYDIIVPFAYETAASGINIQKRCDFVWYQKQIEIKKKKDKRYLLHFEGSDYITKLFVNGKYVGRDKGAYHRISFDITDFIIDGTNLLTVRCQDSYSEEQARGKQRWRDENFECFYVDTTGIYKSVWMEEVSLSYIDSVKITPDVDNKKVILEFLTNNALNKEIDIKVLFDEEVINEKTIIVSKNKINTSIELEDMKLWDVNNPNLYDVIFTLKENGVIFDKVKSYFGMRKIEAKNGKIYLNNRPFYQKLILDQGYYIKGHLTQSSLEEMYVDIIKMKEYGFNGCRKHEKVEDERFLYYCDVIGYLLWSEMPSMYNNTAQSRKEFEREWMKTMPQQYNHPCIITWTIFNESWGIKGVKTDKVIQDFCCHMYDITRAYDPIRFIQVNDGWEHTKSDIFSVHHYEQDGEKFHSYFEKFEKLFLKTYESHDHGILADGFEYKGQPIMFTEFAGTAYEGATKGSKNWGYGSAVKDDKEFVNRIAGLIGAIDSLPYSCGYCFTQLSDVQQEVNGLLFEDRRDKVDPKLIKSILDERKDYED